MISRTGLHPQNAFPLLPDPKSAFLLFLFVLVLLPASLVASEIDRPNVVFFMADDMGLDDTSVYQPFTGNSRMAWRLARKPQKAPPFACTYVVSEGKTPEESTVQPNFR